MKIKCPACSKVLNIPESAAGKVIKCPCGKQLRAPGGNASPGQPGGSTPPAHGAPRPPALQNPAAQSSTAQPSAPRQRAASSKVASSQAAAPMAGGIAMGGGVDDDFFGELTDDDLKPVRAVDRPGQSASASSSGNAQLATAAKKAGKERAARKSELQGGARKEMWSSIGILCLLGTIRVIWNIIQLLAVEVIAEEVAADPSFDGEQSLLVTALRIIFILRIVMGSLFFACAGFFFVFPMSSAVTALVLFIILEIVGLFLNPFAILSIRGWVIRGAMFGALVQAINNASYYKYVKSGARDND